MPSERRLILYRSNRIEALLDCLVEELASPPANPLTPECIVVQSRGMATWLGLRLAERFGVWANPDFPHPRHFMERLLRATLDNTSAAFNRETLALALLELLPRLPATGEFAPLHRYLADGDDWKCLQLAEKIAYLFDQYAVYRPELALAWEEEGAGPAARAESALGDNRWQPLLWRQLSRQFGSPVRPVREALIRLREGRLLRPELLPPRVMLFGITTLPPLYLALFNEAAGIIPVNLLLFSPAREYWADIFAPAALQQRLLRHNPAAAAHGPGDLHLSGGHPLLASLGRVGREFQDILEEQTEYQQGPHGDRFSEGLAVDGRPPTLLGRLQDDILGLRPPTAAAPPAADDRSIVIHSCHSPLREVEVLHDQLLSVLAAGEFSPHEIVVMVPDIEIYAPLIEAVFNRPPGDKLRIPYRIADRPMSREAELLEALLRLFELVGGRLGVSQVLDFLACEPVRRGQGLNDGQLRRIEQWLRRCLVRWGIDEEHRRQHGQPADRGNTWRFGLDRLLLGYAMPGREQHLFGGLLPYDDIEGQDSVTAGLLLAFCERLFKLARRVAAPHPLVQWVELVRQALVDFFDPQDGGTADEWQWQEIRTVLASLIEEGEAAGLARPVELPAFLRLLRARLDESGGSHGFLDGGLTFCTMLPMRTIPFPMVCLLGMSDGAFPRREGALGFDLMAAEPKPGDRSRRQEDRYLFLESLLAARRRLYISYVGRSIRDNRELPPSVLVDELLDCLAAMVFSSGEKDDPQEERQKVVARFVVQHPLQPFSPRYFQDQSGPLFTYAAEYLPEPASPAAGDRPGAEPPGQTPAVALAELHTFFRNPAAWYARRILGLSLPDRGEAAEDREPLFVEKLERHRIGRQLLQDPELILAGPDPSLLAIMRAAGALPPGGAAAVTLAAIIREVEPVAAFLAANPGGRPLPPLTLDLALPTGIRLVGELGQRGQAALLRSTPGKTSPAFFLVGWLDHLALCAQAPPDQTLQTIMVGRGDHNLADIRILRPLAPVTARELLQDLLELFQLGQRQPLPFFRRSSYELVSKLSAGGKTSAAAALVKARQAAHNAFYGTGYDHGVPPEATEPYVEMTFAPPHLPEFDGTGELLPGFEEVAQRVYQPMTRQLEKF
ncbi:exodeoxyribonuclease V subunit gamma [Desulfurivibrio sp. D14AmB]|uniref:exodeoxyribonuclease V subunit gamma n=1 Tax=Desulfurivibrio sp. D14AmB TaxID=3374370 RepID=UPI00376EF973